MKLQLALDGDFSQALTVLQAAHPYVDIAEIGTPLIFREGLGAARRLRQAFPDLPLLADLKIMDAGEMEAALAFEAGCDLVTVLGVTQDATLRGALAAARRFGKEVMVDMMQVTNSSRRAQTLLEMGCHYLCVHTAYDLKTAGVSPLATLEQLRRDLPDAPLVVAGGVGLDTIEAVVALRPKIVVVGGAITGAADPAGAAQAIRERMGV